MRRAAKVDDNQAAMVARFRKWGATVQPLHAVGEGCPDLLVGFRGQNWLVEVKDGKKSPSRRCLTAEQEKWHGEWRGQVCIMETLADVDQFMELAAANIREDKA